MKQAYHLAHFISSVQAVHATAGGTKETSYYTAINNLLDGVGDALKPKVRAVMQLKNLGAGNPDGGLFTADQFDPKTAAIKNLGAPARGVIEIKSPGEAVNDTAASAQIDKYWARYQLVLVTNLRDWLLLGERHGKRTTLERFTLAATETDFWALQPTPAQKEQGAAFADFLSRVLTHNAPLTQAGDLAAILASYAREARHRVEKTSTDPEGNAAKQLHALQASLEASLGVSFQAQEGAHFFRSTLVQTLFYGMFSAWVLQHEADDSATAPAFDWRSAQHSLNVPMIAALFAQISQPAKLKALNLTEVLDWATDALNRVDKTAFFKHFESARSIQYFYEPFLAAFDPELRKRLGVWYTPEEVVRYQVARVDQVLQTELGLAAGLADDSVVVLDPCCGTGAYLVEVLRLIGKRLGVSQGNALAAHQLKAAVTQRLFGFELLPAPYVVAHLQLGLLLRQLGAPLAEDERAGVYLTNALTGWEPPKAPKTTVLPFPEFEEERDAADTVKRTQKIIVILGNPPYDAYNGVAIGEEQDLVAPYKEGLIKTWGIKKFNLDDLYVRFFRLAERRIAEYLPDGAPAGRGVVCYITNFSYVREPSFVVMRQHLLNNFDQVWIDNLNGDSRETGKTTPEGLPDPSVFSTPYNREGIRKGTAVTLLVKNPPTPENSTPQPHPVRYRDWWGTNKREALLQSLDDPQREALYQSAQPSTANKFSFKPSEVGTDYLNWPRLNELCEAAPINGLMEKRGGALIDMDKAALTRCMTAYFDPKQTDAQVRALSPALMRDAAGYVASTARQKLLKEDNFQASRVVRYAVRPFDVRHAYYSNVNPLWNRPRPSLWQQHTSGNRYLLTRPKGVTDPEGHVLTFTSALGDNDALRGHAYYFPLRWHQQTTDSGLFGDQTTARANLSPLARDYLHSLGLPHPDTDRDSAEALWLHALAVGYSPAYLHDNADGIRQDWPRIPLPHDKAAFLHSVALGRQVAALLDTETHVPGVTAGSLPPELAPVAVLMREGGGALKPEEFALTAGWGSQGKEGVTMPGKGRTRHARERDPQAPADALDIFLNAQAFWANVPQAVWDFTIGGYQVMKKWLSYREQRVLGRALTIAEITEVTHMARRLTALVALQPALDTSYHTCRSSTYTPSPASTNT